MFCSVSWKRYEGIYETLNTMKFIIDEAQLRASKTPHEIFLTNLIVNHILYFIATLGVFKSLPQLVAATPLISMLSLGYILFRGRQSATRDPWFVQCHWQVAMKRSRLLLMMLAGLILLLSTLYAIHIYGEVAFSQVFPLAAVVAIPMMVTILALIIMESEALHFARSGQLPRSIVEKYPAPADVEMVDEDEEGHP
jgi:hypothetical protein